MRGWQRELAAGITTLSDLERRIDLQAEERDWFLQRSTDSLPFRITPYYFSLILEHKNDPDYPLRLQAIPRVQEHSTLESESSDPLFEKKYSPFPGFIHRYPSRALVLISNRCALYCRHCFRRHHTGQLQAGGIPSIKQLKAYLVKNVEIKELLLSGGDPLMLENRDFFRYLDQLLAIRPDLVLRICTRVPITLPSRITRSLIHKIQKRERIWLVTQVNHPDELSSLVQNKINKLRKAGIPLLNQTVLLKKINDNTDILKRLSNTLVRCGIKPYYLFQGDLAAGTAHLRVPISQSYEIVRQLRKELSGLAMPQFAVDLPSGGGKVPLAENYLKQKDEKGYLFSSLEDKNYYYPLELD